MCVRKTEIDDVVLVQSSEFSLIDVAVDAARGVCERQIERQRECV